MLVDARKKEILTEDHMLKLAIGEDGRLRQEIIKVDHGLNNLKEQKNVSEVGHAVISALGQRQISCEMDVLVSLPREYLKRETKMFNFKLTLIVQYQNQNNLYSTHVVAVQTKYYCTVLNM